MKRMKRYQAVVVIFAMMISLCGNGMAVDAAKKAKKAKVSKVTVKNSITGSSKRVSVAKGKKVKLVTKVSVKPNKKANRKVTYKSSNKKIAKVSSKGVVKGVKAGKTKITVTSKKNKKKKATIKVTVYKNAVKKVKLNFSNKVLNLGESTKLKATLTGKKGFCKSVKWTSSNPGVATVSNKGQVTTVAKGETTIKVAALDGSGKKASCKIVVENPINLAAVAVQNAQTINFSLDKACTTIDISNVTIRKKAYSNGNYQYTCKIDNLSSADGVNYTAIVTTNDRIYIGDVVQVSIPENYGMVTSMETIFSQVACAYTDEYIGTGLVGYDVDEYIQADGYGYETLSMTGGAVPAGCNVHYKNGDVRISGTPTVAGVSTAEFSGMDELGNMHVIKVIFVIGSDTQIATYTYPRYCLTGVKEYTGFYTRGGSGNYTYAIAGTSYGTEIYFDDDGYAGLSGSFGVPGLFDVPYTVTDSENPTIASTGAVHFDIQQACVVSGVLTDANGAAIATTGYSQYKTVKFINKDRAERHGGSIVIAQETKDEASYQYTGAFSASLAAGTYDVEATFSCGETEATQYLYDVVINSSRSGFDIKLPLHKSVIYSSNETVIKNFGTWKDASGDIVGYGNSLYLKEGTYNLTYKEYEWLTATTTITIPSAQQYCTATVNAPSSVASVGTNVYSTPNGRRGSAFLFIPPESSEYTFSSDDDSNVLLYTMDSQGSMESISKTSELVANKTYYVVIKTSAPMSTLTIEKYTYNYYDED